MLLYKKKIVFIQAIVALMLLFSSGASATRQTSSAITTKSGPVETTLYQGDSPFMTMTITPPTPVFNRETLANQDYATVEIQNEGVTTAIGQAKLPTLSRFIEIPQDAQPDLVITSVTWQTTTLSALHLPSSIIPVQPSLVKIEGASTMLTIDDAYYAMNSYLPSTIATVTGIGELRGRNVAFLELSPVQYNPATGELRIMTQCELRINLPGSDLGQTAQMIDRYSTPAFEQLSQTSFVNYGAFQGTGQKLRQEGYLIIVYDSFYDAIQPLATWKGAKGFDVTVTQTSEIPGGATKENIHAYIVDAYTNWPIPPAYVLLVGDVAQIPTYTGTETGTCTDLYYVTIDAGNYFPDVIISRFSAITPEQVTTQVDKTVYYETGSFPDNAWIKKATFIASNDPTYWSVAEGTHNYVISTYLEPANYTCDKIYGHSGGNTQDIINALDDGRSLAVYSGHGSTDSWAGPAFNQANINSLTNDGFYPFVCSHACLTNQFTVGECFGETWLRAPHKGGVAFWGATTSSYWDEDDILERRMFKAWWEDDIETIGGMTNMGLMYLYQYYSGGGMSKYYFEEYNVLGDSSVKIWRGDVNSPPNTPEKPNGPATGEIGVEYTFTSSTTDPQANSVYYYLSWGDTNSDWLGPYNSGDTIGFPHTWTAAGTYNISIKAKDIAGLESGWSESSQITIVSLPRIEIGAITGGFGLSAQIKNVGSADASNVTWSISLTGGLVLCGRHSSGNVSQILPGSAASAKSKFCLGFGPVSVLISAGGIQKTASAVVIGPFFVKVR